MTVTTRPGTMDDYDAMIALIEQIDDNEQTIFPSLIKLLPRLHASIQAFVDDKAIGGTLDMLESGADPVWVSLDVHEFKPGTHTLRFEGRGPSPRMRTGIPRLLGFGMQQLFLLRLEDMAGYKTK